MSNRETRIQIGADGTILSEETPMFSSELVAKRYIKDAVERLSGPIVGFDKIHHFLLAMEGLYHYLYWEKSKRENVQFLRTMEDYRDAALVTEGITSVDDIHGRLGLMVVEYCLKDIKDGLLKIDYGTDLRFTGFRELVTKIGERRQIVDAEFARKKSRSRIVTID